VEPESTGLEPAFLFLPAQGFRREPDSGFSRPTRGLDAAQPVYFQDFMTSEAARIEYWDFRLEGWDGYRDAQPNAIHRAIVALESA
jgi:hypothetical protein